MTRGPPAAQCIVHLRARRRAGRSICVARARGIPIGSRNISGPDRLDDLLLQRVVHDELVFNSADHPRPEIPLGMAADEDALLDEPGPVGLHRHRHVDAALRVVEVRAHEEEDAIAFAIPERVVQKQGAVVEVWIFFYERVPHLTERHDQLPRARLHIDDEQPVVLRVIHIDGPVPRAGIARHRPQPRHARVVDGRECTAILFTSAIRGRVDRSGIPSRVSYAMS